MEHEISLNIAEAFFEGLGALRGLVWCAHTLSQWERLDALLSQLEAPILSAYLEPAQIEARIEAITVLRRSLAEAPQGRDSWGLIASQARRCLEVLGDDCAGLPTSSADEEPSVPNT